jgi:hypothetical protein
MSGSRIPYHLRHNKSIDRNLFLELLNMINRYNDISKYVYYGFGGAFLEDFKLIHNQTGIKAMISIEQEEEVIKRQKFNSPSKCIKYKHIKSDQFISDFNSSKPTIVWLDYASAKELGSQLNEIGNLSSKLKSKDILRITLNANPNTLLDEKNVPEDEDLKELRCNKLESRIGRYLIGIDKGEVIDKMTANGYPQILSKVIRFAINQGRSGMKSYFQPLTSFAYNDSHHTMLTFCGIILDSVENKEFFKKTGIDKWNLGGVKDGKPHKINIPELSIRERLFIDSLLPAYSTEKILKKLKFFTGKNERETLKQIENYAKFYRQYPYFSKVVP